MAITSWSRRCGKGCVPAPGDAQWTHGIPVFAIVSWLQALFPEYVVNEETVDQLLTLVPRDDRSVATARYKLSTVGAFKHLYALRNKKDFP